MTAVELAPARLQPAPAAVLGIVVHPVLWVIVIVAALWLFGRSRSRSSRL